MKHAVLALSIALASSAPALAWTCYSANSLGGSFYGVGLYEYIAAREAMAACQVSTPWGATCWLLPNCSAY